MSLIHEALKKLEGSRTGYTQEAPRQRGLILREGPGRPVLIAVLVAALLAGAGVAVYLKYRAPVSSLGRSAGTAPPAVRETHRASAVEDSQKTPRREKGLTAEDRNRRGIELYNSGDFQGALAEFKSLLAVGPKDPALHNNAGLAYLAIGDMDGAERSFKEALMLDPENTKALNNYGNFFYRRGEVEKALMLYGKAVSIDPLYADAHLNMAAANERLGRTEDAISHYERFLSIHAGGRGKAVRPDGAPLETEVRKRVADLRSEIISSAARSVKWKARE